MTSLQRLWIGHRQKFWPIIIGLLGVSCLNRLLKEFGRLIWYQGNSGAIDLKIFYEAVQLWFSGAPTYGELPSAVYPPASYLMLWPFLGWLTVSPARILWAMMTVFALAWLVYLVIHESKADSWHEQALIGLLPLFYATRTGIGNGQLVVFVMPLLIAGVLRLRQPQRQLHQTLLATMMIIGALIKPNVSAPFFWIVLFASVGKRYSPAIMVILGYGALTLWAAMFQDDGAIALMQQWFNQAEVGAEFGAQAGGYANQNSLMSLLEASTNLDQYPLLRYVGDFELNTPLTLLMLGALGIWVGWYHNAEIWVLLGICAIIARFWTYHRIYDDILILLPIIATFRTYKQLTGNSVKPSNSVSPMPSSNKSISSLEAHWVTKMAGSLWIIAYIAAVMPANWLEIEGVMGAAFQVFQIVTWLGLLGFLGYYTWRSRKVFM